MLKKVAICLALAGAPQFAAAQSVQDSIVSQLRAQGFSEISLNRTWLGRVRVVAVRDDVRRELVFNPQTGEILRDYWRDVDDDGFRLLSPGSWGSSDDDNDRDDDDDGDDRDDDKSDDDDRDDDDEPDDDEPDDDEPDDDERDDD